MLIVLITNIEIFGTHRFIVVDVVLLKSLTIIGAEAVGFEASGGSTAGAGGPVATVEIGATAVKVLLRFFLGGRVCRCRRVVNDGDGSLPTFDMPSDPFCSSPPFPTQISPTKLPTS